MDKQEIKKIRKEKLQVFFITSILCFVLVLIIFNIIFLVFYELGEAQVISYTEEHPYFNYYVEKYQNDVKVLEIVDVCKKQEFRVECVYANIPFKYDWNRARNEDFGVLSPTEIFERDGYAVCRDYSVIVKIVLNKLGIKSIFVFKPKHVYVVAFENNKTYELNNGRIFER